MVITEDRTGIQKLKEKLEKVHPIMQFIMEEKTGGQLPFLAVFIRREERA